jgi:hypothetical protein
MLRNTRMKMFIAYLVLLTHVYNSDFGAAKEVLRKRSVGVASAALRVG